MQTNTSDKGSRITRCVYSTGNRDAKANILLLQLFYTASSFPLSLFISLFRPDFSSLSVSILLSSLFFPPFSLSLSCGTIVKFHNVCTSSRSLFTSSNGTRSNFLRIQQQKTEYPEKTSRSLVLCMREREKARCFINVSCYYLFTTLALPVPDPAIRRPHFSVYFSRIRYKSKSSAVVSRVTVRIYKNLPLLMTRQRREATVVAAGGAVWKRRQTGNNNEFAWTRLCARERFDGETRAGEARQLE